MALLTCSAMTRAIDEPLAGTAAYARGWVLVEWNRSWPSEATEALGAAGSALRTRIDDLPVRLQLIRRPGTHTDRQSSCRVVVAHTGLQPWMEQFTVGSVDELVDLPVEAAAAPQAPGVGRSLAGPLVLVCAHASRDQCCAVIGRPVAAALTAGLGEAVFETSHVGGHRFAGNVVCLPTGLMLGGLDPSNAVTLVGQAAAIEPGGPLSPELEPFVRGRSFLQPHEQVAELAVARHAGGLASSITTARTIDHAASVDEVPTIGNSSDEGGVTDIPASDAVDASRADDNALGRYTVVVQSCEREFVVDVRHRQTDQAVLASCGDDALAPLTRFDIAQLTEVTRHR